MATTDDKFKISHEDHAEGIRRRVYDGWTTSQIIDSWIEKYPKWKHIDRKKFRDASSLSNPNTKRCSAKWHEIYERTFAEFREERAKILEATAGKASSAISELVEKVRSGIRDVIVENARDLLAVARSIIPVKEVALHEAAKSSHEHNRSRHRNNQPSTIDRLQRHRRLDRGSKKTE